MSECQHLEVKFWEEERPTSVVTPGPVPQPVKVRFGGWKCAVCGMKFYPRVVLEQAIKQLKDERG